MSARSTDLELGAHVLDDQLCDAEGLRCGRVDDLELEGRPGEELRLSAILTGAGVWAERLPRGLCGAMRALTPSYAHRVPWEHVRSVTMAIELDAPAEALGLKGGDGRGVVWLGRARRRAPEVDAVLGRMRLSELIGCTLATENGTPAAGHVYDVRVRNTGDDASGPWTVEALRHGTQALRDRLRARDPGGDARGTDIPWERVTRISSGVIAVEGLADLVAL